MKLSGAQFEAISQSFLDAFDPGALETMVRVQLDRRLDEIAAPGSLTAVIHDLIEWAEAEDRVQELIDGACTANPDNVRLRALRRAIPGGGLVWRQTGGGGRRPGQRAPGNASGESSWLHA